MVNVTPSISDVNNMQLIVHYSRLYDSYLTITKIIYREVKTGLR